jgi:hypothetical protein
MCSGPTLESSGGGLVFTHSHLIALEWWWHKGTNFWGLMRFYGSFCVNFLGSACVCVCVCVVLVVCGGVGFWACVVGGGGLKFFKKVIAIFITESLFWKFVCSLMPK